MFKKLTDRNAGSNKGFTLAELLIVVAIVAVLVAIAMPMFLDNLRHTQEGVNLSNARSAYSIAANLYNSGDRGDGPDPYFVYYYFDLYGASLQYQKTNNDYDEAIDYTHDVVVSLSKMNGELDAVRISENASATKENGYFEATNDTTNGFTEWIPVK